MAPLRAAIFDLDGTLVDSSRDLAGAVNRMLSRLGHEPLQLSQIWSFVGEGAEVLVRRSLSCVRQRDGQGSEPPEAVPPALVQESLGLWREAYAACLLDHTRPFPGIEAVLQGPPILRAVLTNKPGLFSRRILEGLRLDTRFCRVVGGDEAARKPDPQGLLSICAALGVRPEEALLIGDSLVDLATAKSARVPSCAVTWGHASKDELQRAGPAHLVESGEALAALLARLVA
jgi:phosphoglycolate phosphatase